MTTNSHELNLADLDDVRLVPINTASRVLGIKLQLAHDWLWQKKFPLRTRKINGKRYVLLTELREYVQKQFSDDEAA